MAIYEWDEVFESETHKHTDHYVLVFVKLNKGGSQPGKLKDELEKLQKKAKEKKPGAAEDLGDVIQAGFLGHAHDLTNAAVELLNMLQTLSTTPLIVLACDGVYFLGADANAFLAQGFATLKFKFTEPLPMGMEPGPEVEFTYQTKLVNNLVTKGPKAAADAFNLDERMSTQIHDGKPPPSWGKFQYLGGGKAPPADAPRGPP